jgi:hypothetical protein
MQHHYGYIKRSVAKDGDHIDVFIGERPESKRAFVIDQVNPKTGKYDEAKVVLGAIDEADARRIYQANYEPGWRGAGAVTEMAMPDFREWVRSGDTEKSVAYVPVTPKQLEMKARAADRVASQIRAAAPTPKQLEMRGASRVNRSIDSAPSRQRRLFSGRGSGHGGRRSERHLEPGCVLCALRGSDARAGQQGEDGSRLAGPDQA